MPSETSTKMHLYQSIKTDILSQIQRQQLLVGDKLPTEAELMEKYQVSRITVSKALNELKEEGVLSRYPSKGTFVAQQPGNFLNQDMVEPDEQIINIACIMPSIADQFALSVLKGISSVFTPERYTLSFYQSHTSASEDYILKRCIKTGIQGILLFPVDQAYYSNQLLYMKISEFPLVLIDRTLPGIDTNYVISDNCFGGSLAIRHLYSLKHRRFAFITRTTCTTASVMLRIQGIQGQIAEYGLSPDSLTILDELDVTRPAEFYCDRISSLIRSQKVTSLIVSESQTALYVYEILTHMGFDIPGEVSVLCFDNPINSIPDFDFFTHINQSEFDMGRDAGIILQQILDRKASGIQRSILTPTLEMRKSTGLSLL